jgi:hypothetical protein
MVSNEAFSIEYLKKVVDILLDYVKFHNLEKFVEFPNYFNNGFKSKKDLAKKVINMLILIKLYD